jgi:predicted ester cyclase
MQVHDAAAVGRRFFEEQDRVRGGPVPELCAPGYTAVLGGNPPMDRSGHEMFSKAFYSAFPDLTHTVDEAFGTSDRVAVRFTLRGTQQAPFMGIPATNRKIAVTANVLMHVSNGTVTRLLGAFDEAGLLRQLGVLQA